MKDDGYIPLVFYHGKKSPYPYSPEIADCFENPELGKHYLLKPFKLIDVTIIPDEELKKNIITAPLQIIMKHIYREDLLPYIRMLAKEKILSENANYENGSWLFYIINYIIKTGEISDKVAFKELLYEALEEEPRSKIMTIFEQHQQEKKELYCKGKLEGKLEGKFEEKAKIINNMLALNIPVDVIMKVTDLSYEEIIEVQKENNDAIYDAESLH